MLKIRRTAWGAVPLHVPVFLILSCFFSLAASAQNGVLSAGAWRQHLPHNSVNAVTTTNMKIVCVTLFKLFRVMPEVGTSIIGYDGGLKKLPPIMNSVNSWLWQCLFAEPCTCIATLQTKSKLVFYQIKKAKNYGA
jgi:hypothetical protein